MKTFPLNQNWTAEYFEPDIDGFEMAPAPEPIDHIQLWTCSPRFARAGFYAYLRRPFEISPSDQCVRYLLHIKHAPASVRIYINDQSLGEATGHLTKFDVTDFVSLGHNKLNLRLDCWQDPTSHFGDIVLLQVPCDQL
jgi:hypothetical protein